MIGSKDNHQNTSAVTNIQALKNLDVAAPSVPFCFDLRAFICINYKDKNIYCKYILHKL